MINESVIDDDLFVETFDRTIDDLMNDFFGHVAPNPRPTLPLPLWSNQKGKVVVPANMYVRPLPPPDPCIVGRQSRLITHERNVRFFSIDLFRGKRHVKGGKGE